MAPDAGHGCRVERLYGKSTLPDADEFGRKINGGSDDDEPVRRVTWDDAQRVLLRGPACDCRPKPNGNTRPAPARRSPPTTWLDNIAWYANNSGKKPIRQCGGLSVDSSGFRKKLFNNGNGPHPVKHEGRQSVGPLRHARQRLAVDCGLLRSEVLRDQPFDRSDRPRERGISAYCAAAPGTLSRPTSASLTGSPIRRAIASTPSASAASAICPEQP